MVGRKGTCYEERRKKTLEENKKRMEQLNLNKLSQSLCKPKKVLPRPSRQSVDLSLVRRSTRVADIREKHAETIAQKKLIEDLTNSGALTRPPSAFFIFMEAFRKLFKKYFPENKSVAAVGKAAGKEWRSMSDSDKAPYVAKAAKKKADYEKAKEEFKNKTKRAETIAQKKLNEDLTKDESSDDSDSQVKNSGSLRRPPSAFFVFMEEFRNLFKQNFPENKSMAAVGKAAGEEWRSMSDSDKAPYVAKAAKKKADYEKAKEEFKNKTNGNGSTSSVFEKSSSEVHDEAEHEATS